MSVRKKSKNFIKFESNLSKKPKTSKSIEDISLENIGSRS